MKTHSQLVAERDRLVTEAQEILNRSGDNDLSGDDATEFDRLAGEIETTHASIARLERADRLANMARNRDANGNAGGGVRIIAGTPGGADGSHDDQDGSFVRRDRGLAGQQILTREQSVDSWCRDNGIMKRDQQPGSFGRWLRGIATGDWSDADHERALAEGTPSAGGNLVPTPLASNVIDLARNATQVIRAGAVTIPMTSQTLKIARLTGEGAPAWRNENAAITAQDMTFDAVTFTARSLDRLVLISRELFEDSDPSAGDVIARAFAVQIALELDRVALRGSGTPPEPRGVLNTSGITTTTHGANGASIVNYDWFLDAAGTVLANNYTPTAHIVTPRTVTSLSKLKEASTNAYLAPPASLLPLLPTKQVPVNLTVGTSSDASEVYTADWSQLAIGIRTGFAIEMLRERYADNLQFAFLAHMRADVQVLQPGAFVVDTGVRA